MPKLCSLIKLCRMERFSSRKWAGTYIELPFRMVFTILTLENSARPAITHVFFVSFNSGYQLLVRFSNHDRTITGTFATARRFNYKYIGLRGHKSYRVYRGA